MLIRAWRPPRCSTSRVEAVLPVVVLNKYIVQIISTGLRPCWAACSKLMTLCTYLYITSMLIKFPDFRSLVPLPCDCFTVFSFEHLWQSVGMVNSLQCLGEVIIGTGDLQLQCLCVEILECMQVFKDKLSPIFVTRLFCLISLSPSIGIPDLLICFGRLIKVCSNFWIYQ